MALLRPRERSESWRRVLEEAGAEVLLAPAIEIRPPDDTSALDDALRALLGGRYSWAVFTSISTVEQVLPRLREMNADLAAFPARVAAVGTGTARALEEAGLTVEKVPSRQDAVGLLETFSDEDLRGARILLPRAERGRDVFPDGARERGAMVEVVTAYRTVSRPAGVALLRARLEAGSLDALLLGSPSQARALVDGLGDTRLLSGCLIACIGPTTARAAGELGLSPSVAESPEPGALVSLLVRELGGSSGRKRAPREPSPQSSGEP